MIAIVGGVAVGCTGTAEVDLEAERRDRTVDDGTAPNWIRAGRQLAAGEESTADEDGADDRAESDDPAEGDRPRDAALVAELTRAGLPAATATCVAARVTGQPELTADVRTALAALGAEAGTTPSVEPAVLRRLTTVVGPCFDAASLAALVVGRGATTAAPSAAPAAPGTPGGATTGTAATIPPSVAVGVPAGLQQLITNLGAAAANLPDLSKVNPLTLVDRTAFVDAARKNGLSSGQAGCLYDQLRSLSPQQLQAAFAPQPDQAAAAAVLSATLGCLVRG